MVILPGLTHSDSLGFGCAGVASKASDSELPILYERPSNGSTLGSGSSNNSNDRFGHVLILRKFVQRLRISEGSKSLPGPESLESSEH